MIVAQPRLTRCAAALFLFAGVISAQESPTLPEVEAAQTAIRNKLKDPSSAQFRNDRLMLTETGALSVCGEVNAKNSYGGYNGFVPYYSAGTVAALGAKNDSTFSIIYPAICAKPR
jgi:hypothetical protein